MTQQEEFNRIHAKLDDINNRLFIDNGKPCTQTRLDRVERILKVMMWISAILFATVATQVTKDTIAHLAADHVIVVD